MSLTCAAQYSRVWPLTSVKTLFLQNIFNKNTHTDGNRGKQAICHFPFAHLPVLLLVRFVPLSPPRLIPKHTHIHAALTKKNTKIVGFVLCSFLRRTRAETHKVTDKHARVFEYWRGFGLIPLHNTSLICQDYKMLYSGWHLFPSTLETSVTLYLIGKLQLYPRLLRLLVFRPPAGRIGYARW